MLYSDSLKFCRFALFELDHYHKCTNGIQRAETFIGIFFFRIVEQSPMMNALGQTHVSPVASLECNDVRQQLEHWKDSVVPALKEVLRKITELPFESNSILLRVLQYLCKFEDYHIVELNREFLQPLAKQIADPVKFQSEVFKVLDICQRSCYTKEHTKLVNFTDFVSILRFSFDVCDHEIGSYGYTALVSKLLELYEALAKGKLVEYIIFKTEGAPENQQLGVLPSTSHFQALLKELQMRVGEGHIGQLIAHATKLIIVDNNLLLHTPLPFPGLLFVESPQPVATFFHCWLELLRLPDVSSDFVVHLAAKDALVNSTPEELQTIKDFSQMISKSRICRAVGALQVAKKKDSSFSIPKDEERLNIFFQHINCFDQYPLLSLELLSATSISNSVLRDTLSLLALSEEDQNTSPSFAKLFSRLATPSDKDVSFHLLCKTLLLLPEGRYVIRVLKFWKNYYSNDFEYAALAGLLKIIVSILEVADKSVASDEVKILIGLLEGLPTFVKATIPAWCAPFSNLIKAYPTSWRRPEVRNFLQWFAILGLRSEPVVPAMIREFTIWMSCVTCLDPLKDKLLCCAMDLVSPQ